jgi:hydrogenase expression/formation protein HypC
MYQFGTNLYWSNEVKNMCVAVPGRVIEINGHLAKIDIMNNIYEANISLVSPKIGDYVLVHAGCAIEVLKKDLAEEMLELFSSIVEDCTETTLQKTADAEMLY